MVNGRQLRTYTIATKGEEGRKEGVVGRVEERVWTGQDRTGQGPQKKYSASCAWAPALPNQDKQNGCVVFRPLAVLSGYYCRGPLAYPQIVYSLFGRDEVACRRLDERGRRQGERDLPACSLDAAEEERRGHNRQTVHTDRLHASKVLYVLQRMTGISPRRHRPVCRLLHPDC